jgi:hypothetical protein
MKVRKTIGICPDCPDGTDGTNPSVLAVLANSHCFFVPRPAVRGERHRQHPPDHG